MKMSTIGPPEKRREDVRSENVRHIAGIPDKANNDDVWRVLQCAMIGIVRINGVGFWVLA